MARGDMAFDALAVNGEIEILNRKEFEAVAMTVDFTGISTTGDNGKKVVKAGTPINASGVPVKTTPFTGAVGLLLHDTYETHPQGAILKVGYVHTNRLETSCGIEVDAALATALTSNGCRIAFEEPILGSSSGSSS